MAQAKRKESSAKSSEGGPVGDAGVSGPGQAAEWLQPNRLTRGGWIALIAVIALIQLPLIHYFLFRSQPAATVELPYSDDFSSPERLEKNYFNTGGLWRIENGELKSPGVRNNPLWLKASLPQDVAVEFDARSESPQGDIKVELFGDGSDHSSGYVFIHGGWNNSVSIISRLDEHGVALSRLQEQARAKAQQLGLPEADLVTTGVFKPDTRMRVEANPFKVEIGKTYRWRIERRGGHIRWTIDGQPFMEFSDPFPLAGKGHDRLGFSSWDATLFFDNLRVEPL